MRYDSCCNCCCPQPCSCQPICPPCPTCPVCPPCPSTFSVVYNPNGGFGGIADFDLPANTIYTVKSIAEAGVYSPSWNFDRWNTQADGFGIDYYPGDTFTLTSNRILYALWMPQPD